MIRRALVGLLVPGLLAILGAQSYRCDWNVVAQAGGTMSSTSYSGSVTVGQTAIGIITSTSYQGFIGFWQIDTAGSGIQEDNHWSQQEPLVTMLNSPFPNPCAGNAQIRYSLATESRVSVRLFDLSGRNLANLISGTQPAGRYATSLFAGRRPLAAGVYFLKMSAGDYRATRKLVVQ